MTPRGTENRPSGRPVRLGRLAIGMLLIASATGFLVYKATGDNLTYYKKVDELLAADPGSVSGKVRLSGDVVDGTIARDDDGKSIRFAIRDPGAGESAPMIRVAYTGIVPDIFKPGIQVVVEGKMDENGVFQADNLLAKCPSKYQAAGQLDEKNPSNK